MQAFSFSPGQRFLWKETACTVSQVVDKSRVFLEQGPGEFVEVSLDELLKDYAAGKVTFSAPHRTAILPARPDGTQRVERTLAEFSDATQKATKRAWDYDLPPDLVRS